MTFSEHAASCPTCGQRVLVFEGDDGKSSYAGLDAERADRAEAALAAAQETLRKIAENAESWLRVIAAVARGAAGGDAA